MCKTVFGHLASMKVSFLMFFLCWYFLFSIRFVCFFVISPGRIRTHAENELEERVFGDFRWFFVFVFYFQSDLCVFLYLAPGGYEHTRSNEINFRWFSVILAPGGYENELEERVFGDFRWFFVFVSSVQITVKRVSSVVIGFKRVSSVVIRVERVSSVVIRVERVYSVVIGFETGFRVKLTL